MYTWSLFPKNLNVKPARAKRETMSAASVSKASKINIRSYLQDAERAPKMARKTIFFKRFKKLPGLSGMVFPAVLFFIGEAGNRFDVMDSAEKNTFVRQFKEERTVSLNNGTITRNICVPVSRVLDGIRRIGNGSRQLTAFSAKAAPLTDRDFLQCVPAKINTGNTAVVKIEGNIPANPAKHAAQMSQILPCPGQPAF